MFGRLYLQNVYIIIQENQKKEKKNNKKGVRLLMFWRQTW